MQITTRFVLYLKILIDKINIFDFFFKKRRKKLKEKRGKNLRFILWAQHNCIRWKTSFEKTLFLRGQVR